MRENMIEVAEAAVQVIVLLALYPVWFLVGLYMHRDRDYRFCCVSKFHGLWIYPAFGRWYLPIIWLKWHY